MRSLEPDELPHHADGIAKTLAHFHVKASQVALCTPPYATQELHCINITQSWIKSARHAVETIPKLNEFKEDVSKLEAACAYMQPLLQKLKAHVPVVLCHNDLLSGNVMVFTDKEAAATQLPRFIDFEYCRRDFALYDIANNWHEWAGYDNDFSKYPNKEQQTKFLKAYFQELAKVTHNDSFAEEIETLCSDAAIERARIITNFLSLAAYLCWSVWSMVQHAYSEIEFDYLDYYRKKFARFENTKEEFTQPLRDAGLL
jgi:thiamine kinase-like enzyme